MVRERRKVVVVGVKLDSRSRELLTWALVKASLPGDQVIALHILDHSSIEGTTSSLLSLVKAFNSVLSVYKGFCNLKQVDLKLKVCRGKSVRKVIVREAELYPWATIVLGVSKTSHGIRSSISVAKHCAAKLPRSYAVFAVDNGRVVFTRESLTFDDNQPNGNVSNAVVLHKDYCLLSEARMDRVKCRHRIRKSCSKCRDKSLEEDCSVSETGSISLRDSTTLLEHDPTVSDVNDKIKCRHRFRKSCFKCRNKAFEEEDCSISESGSVLRGDYAALSDNESILTDDNEKVNCHHRFRKSCFKCRKRTFEEDFVISESVSDLLGTFSDVNEKIKCRHRFRKSCCKCRTKSGSVLVGDSVTLTPVGDCIIGESGTVLPGDPTTQTLEEDYSISESDSVLLDESASLSLKEDCIINECGSVLLNDSVTLPEDNSTLSSVKDKIKCHHRFRKSCPKCRNKTLDEYCVIREAGPVFPTDFVVPSEQDSTVSDVKDKNKCHHRFRKSCSKCKEKSLAEDCNFSGTCSIIQGSSVALLADNLTLGDAKEKVKCRHRFRKSCSKCRKRSLEEDCNFSETSSVILDNPVTLPEDDLIVSDAKEKITCHHRFRKSCSKCRKQSFEEDCNFSDTSSVILDDSLAQLEDDLTEKDANDSIKCHHRFRKSCSNCMNKILEEDCVLSETGSVFLDDSASILEDNLTASDVEEDHGIAMVPVQTNQASLDSLKIRDSQFLKRRWSLLRRLLPSRQHSAISVQSPYTLLQSSRLSRLHSSAIYPDQKQILSSNQDDDGQCSTFDGENGASIPLSPLCSSNSGIESLPKELLSLSEKFSDTCRLFSFQELSQATSNFLPENMVGKGGSGSVYKAQIPDGKEFAVKILKPSKDVIKEFAQEIDIITALSHKNVVSLSGFCCEDDKLLLVYDFLARGSLEDNLHGHKKDVNAFGWRERYRVAVGIAEALDYLHYGCAEPVIHRDVKSSNILLSNDFEPLLSDFGLASWAAASTQVICTNVAGTFGYFAPEYVMHGKVSKKIDVYAFGVVLLELLSGRKPIDRESPKEVESLVMWAKPILESENITQLLDPILGNTESEQENIERMVFAATLCIRHLPRSRPSISNVLKLLLGDEDMVRWAKQQESVSEDQAESDDEEMIPTNIESLLSFALQDVKDDSSSISSSERSISVDKYLRER